MIKDFGCNGNRVQGTLNGVTTAYVNAGYEVSGGVGTSYYFADGQRIAMRKSGVVSYILPDHLGSTMVTTNSSGVKTAEQWYKAWGEVRYTSSSLPTKYTYTGQYSNVSDFGLMYYNARYYDGALGRFVQADTVVPQPGSPQGWDRYAYVLNSPVNFTDPSGHRECEVDADECLGGGYSKRSEIYTTQIQSKSNNTTESYSSAPSYVTPPPIFGYNLNHDVCITSSPCIREWETPWWWDSDPKNPDYIIFTISGGKVIGGTVAFIVDRYGNLYGGLGGNIGKSISSIVISINRGWIGSATDDDFPDQANIGSFLSGLSINAQIGAVGDIAVTWSPHDNKHLSHFSFENGFVLPYSSGISVIFSTEIIDGFRFLGGR